MAEPTSAKSFYDLILAVAREAGVAYYGSTGQERAMIPVDAHDLDLCKKIVNDGIKMFIADAPVRGWRWMRRIMEITFIGPRVTGTVDSIPVANQLADTSLENAYGDNDDLNDWYIYILTGTGAGSYAQITDYVADGGIITVADWLDEDGEAGGTDPVADDTFCIVPSAATGGNTSRYLLAENFGGEVDGPVHYAADTGHGVRIEWRDESQIRAAQAVSIGNGYPNRVAIRPYEPTGNALSATRRWELIVNLWPTATDTIEFPYTLFFDKLRLEAGVGTTGTDGTSLFDSALAGLYPDDYFNGWTIRIIDGDGRNSYGLVNDYVGATGQFEVYGHDWLSIDGTTGGTHPAVGSAYYVEPVANLHPAGFRFDQAILAACLAQAELDVEDVVAGFVNKYMNKDLPAAYAADARSAPRKLGSMNTLRREQRPRYRNDVTYN